MSDFYLPFPFVAGDKKHIELRYIYNDVDLDIRPITCGTQIADYEVCINAGEMNKF